MKNHDAVAETELVKREQLNTNDKLVVITKNSEYRIEVLNQAKFKIMGGWFDKMGLSPFQGSIEGVTWGWGDLMPDIIVKTGMRIKFSNGPTTSQVRSISFQQ